MQRGEMIDIGRERQAMVLWALAIGWKQARDWPEVDAAVREVPLTERLRVAMREALNAAEADWCRDLTILPGTESKSSTCLPRPDGRTDIPVFFTQVRETLREHDPHAIIECKRVAENDADLCRLYVGEGVDRFRSAQYGSRHATGFMAGYVLDGSVAAVVDLINRRLSRLRRRSEHLGKCAVVNEPWTRSSRHPRTRDLPPMVLHHAFLSFADTEVG